MAAKAKASPTKKVVKAKAATKTTEYSGTRQLFNAQEPAKDPKRVAAAKKAKATLRAKLLKRAKTSKKGASKKKGTGKPRGPTAFFVFSAEHRAAVKKAHPSWKVTEIASELGKQWRALSADKKKQYTTKAAAQKPKA